MGGGTVKNEEAVLAGGGTSLALGGIAGVVEEQRVAAEDIFRNGRGDVNPARAKTRPD